MIKQMDATSLQMALVGYEIEREKIQAKISEIQAQLNGRSRRFTAPITATPMTNGRRRMSAAARKRIAAAQRKRWAAFHKNQKAAK